MKPSGLCVSLLRPLLGLIAQVTNKGTCSAALKSLTRWVSSASPSRQCCFWCGSNSPALYDLGCFTWSCKSARKASKTLLRSCVCLVTCASAAAGRACRLTKPALLVHLGGVPVLAISTELVTVSNWHQLPCSETQACFRSRALSPQNLLLPRAGSVPAATLHSSMCWSCSDSVVV